MIYLDNAATTKPCGEALTKANAYLTEKYFNPSAQYKEGLSVSADLKKAREFLLSRVCAPSSFELIFTSGGTEADNQAVFCAGKRGNVVISAGEHSAVYKSCMELKARGIEVRLARLNRDGSVNVEDLLHLVDEKTSLVSVMHVNNETGAINPVVEIARSVKSKAPRCIFHSDGVQAFGKIPVFLTKEIDLYSVSAHKIGGLKGTGALIKRKELALPALLYGGGQEGANRSGTENVFGIMNFYYAAERKFSTLAADEKRLYALRELLWEKLSKERFFRISPESGTPYILTVSATGLRGEIIQRLAEENGLLVGKGSACSSKRPFSRVIEACGYAEGILHGVLRLSFSPETTEEEIYTAAEILNGAANELRGRIG